MNTHFPSNCRRNKASLITKQALTLSEMLVSMGIFSFVVIALVYTHIFCLSQDKLVESKLGASDHARIGFDKLAKEVRSANSWSIGTMSSGAYTARGPGELQQGNAIQLCLSTNTSINIIYYFDATDPMNGKLLRLHTGDTTKVIADHLRNSFNFVVEDYRGNTNITDILDRRVVHFTLDFCQYRYPLTVIATNALFDRFKMEFRLTPHVPGGR